MKRQVLRIVLGAVVLWGSSLAGAASAANVFNMPAGLTDLEFVPVGNAGNAPDTRGLGAVAYAYDIGKYEVTAGQYATFLNAVAATDAYDLYNTKMVSTYGCNVKRSGSVGSYTYSVDADWANRPVNYVSWGDCARFVNWLTNGQPTGVQDASTTEDGSYVLNGVTDLNGLLAVTRKTAGDMKRYCIPTEKEWYKAAYHKNDGVTGNYWDYPTRSDSAPGRDMSETTNPGNNANYKSSDYLIGSPYYRTPVGEFELSDSPYGTFDQGGNVAEWNETIWPPGSYRGVCGGSFWEPDYILGVDFGLYGLPTYESYATGFRVAIVPEPASIGMLGLGVVGILWVRRAKRSR